MALRSSASRHVTRGASACCSTVVMTSICTSGFALGCAELGGFGVLSSGGVPWATSTSIVELLVLALRGSGEGEGSTACAVLAGTGVSGHPCGVPVGGGVFLAALGRFVL